MNLRLLSEYLCQPFSRAGQSLGNWRLVPQAKNLAAIIIAIYSLLSIYSLYFWYIQSTQYIEDEPHKSRAWRHIFNSLPWIHSQIHRNKSDSKYVLDRVHCCLYFRSTKRANKCQESGTSAQNIVLGIQKQTNKNKDKTKQKGQVKMWEARILLWKFISGSAISDYLK